MSSSEYFAPEPHEIVRQGDILICRDPETKVISDVCLVITADCDISQGKFGRLLACLRVVPFDEYVKTLWAEKKLLKAKESALKGIKQQLDKWNRIKSNSESNFSFQTINSWIKRCDAITICNELDIPEPDRKKVSSAIEKYKSAVFNDDSLGSDFLSQYAAFTSVLNGKKKEDCYSEATDKARIEKLGEDVFILPTLPQLESGPWVVLLRGIINVDIEMVCYRSMDAIDNHRFLRIGRLVPTYKYAISQAFGALYSRIGLPEDYENRCKVAINNVVWG